MRISALILLLSLLAEGALSGTSKLHPRLARLLAELPPNRALPVWVFLADKGPGESTVPADAVAERSVRRRMKVRPDDRLVDRTDLPVFEPYAAGIALRADRVRQRSRWFNALSVEATAEQVAEISGLPFVTALTAVARFGVDPRERDVTVDGTGEGGPSPPALSAFNYGSSFNQVNQIAVPPVHDLGNYGQGVLIGVFDNGFRLLTHEVFDTLRPRILATYDFVDHKTSVVPNNPSTAFGSHGINTLSTLGGFRSGQLIGPAFGADYLLLRTENDSSETPVEEDNWIAGIEWADSIGVDVTSTSLSYLDYDPPDTSWTWQDMDGNSTLITRAADMAVERGIVVVNSAGNAGFNASRNTLGAPADGDSVLTVGAVTSTGARSSFSSVGPTTSTPPRIKPDVMAMGSSVRVASASNPAGYGTASGTSFSCPLTAGVVGLLIHARPTDGPMEIISALKGTANRSTAPDNLYGWGIINALAALRPSAPTLSFPAAGATDLSTDLFFSWHTLPWATGYRVEVGSDSLFASVVATDTVAGDTVCSLTGLPAGALLYWRVRGGNLYGPGPWGTVRSFTTSALPPAQVPVLLLPANGAAGQPPAVQLRWSPVPAASRYRIQVATDSLLTALQIDDSTLTDTAYAAALSHATTYYWRVRGENGAGPGPFAPAHLFRTVVAPPAAAPALLLPPHGAFGIAPTVEFRWTSAPGAQMYFLRVSRDSAFTVIVYADSLLTDTLATVGALLPGRTYYWSVSARNEGGSGPWAPAGHFTVNDASAHALALDAGWNLLSLPLRVPDASIAALFPGAVSRAFGFTPETGYVAVDTLAAGGGYWIKFASADSVTLAGEVVPADTISVSGGWNLVGGISSPLDTASVIWSPAGNRSSEYYGFEPTGYSPVSILTPGKGYWVKAGQNGVLFLQGSSPAGVRPRR